MRFILRLGKVDFSGPKKNKRFQEKRGSFFQGLLERINRIINDLTLLLFVLHYYYIYLNIGLARKVLCKPERSAPGQIGSGRPDRSDLRGGSVESQNGINFKKFFEINRGHRKGQKR